MHYNSDYVDDLNEELARYKRALESIAANKCCAPCQEAALVAKKALDPSRGPNWGEALSQ